MKIITIIQEKFWILAILSIILGLVFPPINPIFNNLLIPLVMTNFFFSSLKVDFLEVIAHIKKPFLLGYILIIYLLIIPAIIYFLFQFINPELAIAMLLLASMPAGASAPMLTHIFKGNISLSMAITLVGFLLTPFSVVFLFFILTRTAIHIDLLTLFQTMIVINFIPLILAQATRKFAKTFVEKKQQYFSLIGIFCICLIGFIAISGNAKEILQIPINNLLVDIFWLYIIFGLFSIVGLFVIFWKNKDDRIATAVTKTYMNNALGIGIAVTFFNPKIALIMVLSSIPWGTTLGIFKYFLKFLKEK